MLSALARQAHSCHPGTCLHAHLHLLKHLQRAIWLVASLQAGDHCVVADGVWLQALQATQRTQGQEGTGTAQAQHASGCIQRMNGAAFSNLPRGNRVGHDG